MDPALNTKAKYELSVGTNRRGELDTEDVIDAGALEMATALNESDLNNEKTLLELNEIHAQLPSALIFDMSRCRVTGNEAALPRALALAYSKSAKSSCTTAVAAIAVLLLDVVHENPSTHLYTKKMN